MAERTMGRMGRLRRSASFRARRLKPINVNGAARYFHKTASCPFLRSRNASQFSARKTRAARLSPLTPDNRNEIALIVEALGAGACPVVEREHGNVRLADRG